MTKNVRIASRAAACVAATAPLAVPGHTSGLTLVERLQRIEAMGHRIDTYIRSMGQVVALHNASAELKERAVTAFYERMVVAEKQLGRIHEEFQLE